jgi:LysM repeat protein
MVEKLIKAAEGELGYYEKASNKDLDSKTANKGKGNYTKYGAWIKWNPGSWCHMFVSWCAELAGIGRDIIPKTASCDIGMTFFRDADRWEPAKAWGGKYTPKRGDIIYYSSTGKTWDSTHVGIVTEVKGGNVYSIEGNAGDCVQRQVHSLSDKYILGYGLPAYVHEKPSAGAGAVETYTVQKGDTMYGIAKKLGVQLDKLIDANNIADPSRIYVGQVLTVPGEERQYYVVEMGDTLSSIADRFDTSVNQLVEWNEIKNPNVIHVGDRLRVG